jgi:hypothetical protein
MQIKLISGNFQAIVSGEVSSGNVNVGTEKEPKLQPAQDVINDCGLTYIGQRDGWTGFYKPRLKKGQERSELEYSEDLALEVATSLESTLSPYLDGINVEVTEHVPSEGGASEMKRATALVDSFLGTDMESAYRQILGSANGDRDALIAIAHEKKLGITPPREKKTAKA